MTNEANMSVLEMIKLPVADKLNLLDDLDEKIANSTNICDTDYLNYIRNLVADSLED